MSLYKNWIHSCRGGKEKEASYCLLPHVFRDPTNQHRKDKRFGEGINDR
jgi:hypothetical protein